LVISPLPPFWIKTACAARPLGSTGITPLLRYYGPGRHPLAFARFPGFAGYTIYLAPPISRWDEDGFSGVRHRSDEEPLIKDAAPPSNLQTCLELTATQSQDGMGTPNGPEHSRLLAARADPCLASSFDDAGADEQVLSAERIRSVWFSK